MATRLFILNENKERIFDGGSYDSEMYEYSEEKISPCDTCRLKKSASDKDYFSCYGCFEEMETIYKVSKNYILDNFDEVLVKNKNFITAPCNNEHCTKYDCDKECFDKNCKFEYMWFGVE